MSKVNEIINEYQQNPLELSRHLVKILNKGIDDNDFKSLLKLDLNLHLGINLFITTINNKLFFDYLDFLNSNPSNSSNDNDTRGLYITASNHFQQSLYLAFNVNVDQLHIFNEKGIYIIFT